MLNYTATPTAAKFHNSNGKVRAIMGPVGSGKSVACVVDIFHRASQQTVAPDGFRYSRWIVVRNTYNELKNTTMKTFDEWLPQETFGKRSGAPPYTQKIEIGDIKLEVIFLALDKESDQRKLLSLEPTGVWFNEAREINRSLVMAATQRVGRYPTADKGGSKWSGVILDTNPPPHDHWYYEWAEEHTWRKDPETGVLIPLEEIDDDERYDFFRQPSGLSEAAENVENLMQSPETVQWELQKRREWGQKKYYKAMCFGKTKEEINVMVHGNYGSMNAERAVFANEWMNGLHFRDKTYRPPQGSEIIGGIDCSGRNPAVVFMYVESDGSVHCFDEVVEQGVSAKAFATKLRKYCEDNYGKYSLVLYGDPAGGWKSQTNDQTYIDILRNEGFKVYPAKEGLRVAPRVESMKSLLEERDDKDKAMFYVYSELPFLYSAFNGGYMNKTYHANNQEYITNEPDKRKSGRHADVMDACMYGVVGMGGVRRMRGRKRLPQRIMETGFSVFGK